MIEPGAFYEALRRHGLDFFSGVPDSLLKDLCAYITEHVPADRHVINANEGSAVALAAGYHLATGRIPVVYLQNSGTGSAINPLLSLADPAVYGIPMLLIIGWRGEPGVPDEPQHVTQGRVMTSLLDAIELPYVVVDANTDDVDGLIGAAVARMREGSRPMALLVRRGTFAPYGSPTKEDALPMARPDAVALVLDALGSKDVVVSTTGMTSREVFAYRAAHGQGHERDFLTVGSMGHASQIAMGLALHQSERRVVCLDGDGAMIMHMGSLAVIGAQAPARLRHVVINNGAHDSVGGQPTAGMTIDLAAVARACGYRGAASAGTADEARTRLRELLDGDGPALLEIRVRSLPETRAGRPTSTPSENKSAFARTLRGS